MPILANGELLGAYTVSAPIDRLLARRAEYLDVLRDAAEAARDGAEAALSRMPAATD